MLKVTIELISAVTGKTSEIGRMYIANDAASTDPHVGDYKVAVCRRGRTMPPREIIPSDGADSATRSGQVKNYPRLAHNVWRLIARALHVAFPEEARRSQRSARQTTGLCSTPR